MVTFTVQSVVKGSRRFFLVTKTIALANAVAIHPFSDEMSNRDNSLLSEWIAQVFVIRFYLFARPQYRGGHPLV